VTLSEHPGVVQFMMFEGPPGRVTDLPRERATYSLRAISVAIFPDAAVRLARLGADTAKDRVEIIPMAMARMLAKIALSFAVAELGINALEETYVAHLVLNDAPDWNYWIGGYKRCRRIDPGELHELRFLRRGDDLSVIVHLFVPYCPQDAYEVVVGRLRPGMKIPPALDGHSII
jgi:hypothetical protein